MDDDIVINIDFGSGAALEKSTQKGGRWVDRFYFFVLAAVVINLIKFATLG